MQRIGLLLLTGLLVATLVAGCGPAGPASTVDASFDGAQATVRAVNVAFQPTEISLPSGTPLRIILDNRDAGVPHDIKVIQGDREFGRSATITGPGQTEVRFGPLPAGSYQFVCVVHPGMTGTLTITP
jgi:plastocyanin